MLSLRVPAASARRAVVLNARRPQPGATIPTDQNALCRRPRVVFGRYVSIAGLNPGAASQPGPPLSKHCSEPTGRLTEQICALR